jgi:hypothetical protein
VQVAKVILSVLFAASLSSCGKSDIAQPTVAIQRAVPSGDVVLTVGETVRFSVVVRAQNFKGPGHVGLIVQSAEGIVLGISDPKPIGNGGNVQLEAAVTVPKTASLRVFAPLFLGEKMETSVLDTRIYKVL